MGKRSKMGEVAISIFPLSGNIAQLNDAVDPEGRGYTSPASPTNLRHARSHGDLAGRKEPPLSAGVSLREPLETEDYDNWD